jgi:hypothetical protein
MMCRPIKPRFYPPHLGGVTYLPALRPFTEVMYSTSALWSIPGGLLSKWGMTSQVSSDLGMRPEPARRQVGTHETEELNS